MNKRYLYSLFIIPLLLLITLQSCKKESTLGIDNNKVIKTPYSLYVADADGALYLSNDGERYQNIFPPDAYPTSIIIMADTNILFLKKNLHLSQKDARNFNPTYLQVEHFPWQAMAYNFKPHHRIYITSKLGKGVAFSKDNGVTWETDEAWAENLPPSIIVSSFAGLTSSNALFAFSNKNSVLLRKSSADDNWNAVTAEGFFPVDGTEYYLVSSDNTLFLVDYKGGGGVWFSEDEGSHWKRFQQGDLPRKINWNSAFSPEGGKSLLVGTDSTGVYRVDNDRFVPSTGGLEIITKVYSFTEKSNTYKNDNVKNYVFIATDKGIYRSEDRGRNWDKMTYGTLQKKFTAVN